MTGRDTGDWMQHPNDVMGNTERIMGVNHPGQHPLLRKPSPGPGFENLEQHILLTQISTRGGSFLDTGLMILWTKPVLSLGPSCPELPPHPGTGPWMAGS